MGHRASVAYKTESGVTCHYSHWGASGAALLDQITEETPFGSENMEPEFVNGLMAALTGMTEENDMEVEGELTKPQDPTPVEPEPYAICDSLETWATEHVDYLMHECVYSVDTTQSPWEVKAYAPIYWREALDEGELRGCIIEAGEKSHDLWGGVNADSWEAFLRVAEGKAKRELGREVELIY